MNLLQVRQLFRQVSGRFDLVNEDGSDNGADFYINEGRKFLDRLNETQRSVASTFKFLKVGHFTIQFPLCRAIKEVWASSSTARWQVYKKPIQDLVYNYMSGLPSSRNTGQPQYYSPGLLRYVPEDLTADQFEALAGWVDIPAGKFHEFNSILFSCPTNLDLTIEVKGLFYSHYLSSESDENFWSITEPMLLVMSAMRKLEIVNRNRQGVNDWTDSIATETTQLGFDFVEEDIAEVDQMEG